MPLLLIIYRTVFKIYIMKKILLFIFSLFCLSYYFGQGNNLQFSQVLNLDFSSTCNVGYSWSSAGTFTVSSNKVLKITSCSAFATDLNSFANASGASMKIGNKLVYNQGHNTNISNGVAMPVWLESGTYTVYLFGRSTNSSDNNLKGSISAVEFNIVQ